MPVVTTADVSTAAQTAGSSTTTAAATTDAETVVTTATAAPIVHHALVHTQTLFTKDIEDVECDTDNESLASTASKRARVEEPQTAGASDDKRKWTAEEEEELLVEYIKAHPYIYDKSLKDHKNTQLKDSIYSAFGLKIGATAAQVRKWYENKRTQYETVGCWIGSHS